MTSTPTRIGIMIDTESLGLEPASIVREFAFMAFDLDDPETILREAEEFLPLIPQQMLGRTISLDTVMWMMDQPDNVRARLKESSGNDLDELLALVRSLTRKLGQTIDGASYYEVWFARPQHDEPMIKSLFKDCGESVPWKYDTVNDLRTLMNAAGLPHRGPEVDALKAGVTTHTARGDCIFQIRCLMEAQRRLRARS